MHTIRELSCAALFLISLACGGQSDGTPGGDDSAAAGESSGGADSAITNLAGETSASAGAAATSGAALGAGGANPSGGTATSSGGIPDAGGVPGSSGANPSGGTDSRVGGAPGSGGSGVGGNFPTCEPMPFGPDDFVTRWSITADTCSITLPLVADGDYDFVVDWGDGTSDTITAATDSAITHEFAAIGTCQVTISGTITGWAFPCEEFCASYVDYTCLRTDTRCVSPQLTEIANWGRLEFGDASSQFRGCENLTISATDTPLLPHPTDLTDFFYNCTPTLTGAPLSAWDTSGVTSMSGMFGGSSISCDLSTWDTSNVTDMSRMFEDSSFDGDLSAWDTSAVTNLASMFHRSAFNGDISAWDTSSVTDMSYLFAESSFDGDISAWDTSSVTDMHDMFHRSVFNGDLSAWNTSSVTDMSHLFASSQFDQDISTWSISSATTMNRMFEQGVLSTANYDRLLVAWAAQNPSNPVVFSAGDTMYSAGAPAEARNALLGRGWTITDGGQLQ